MKNLLLSFLIFFLISCKVYKPIEFKGIDDYSFSSDKGCNPICVTIGLYNPNPYNVSFKSALVEANLDDDDLGDLKLNTPSTLKKKMIFRSLNYLLILMLRKFSQCCLVFKLFYRK